MHIARDLPTLRAELDRLGPVALVPTMGALHAGHMALLAEARRHAPYAVVSIFVNPLQFGPAEDFARYPRREPEDLDMLASAGCDVAWLPTVEVMYPPGGATTIEIAGPAEGWEGAARPGHFRGVATVCTKLFQQTRAVAALFGEKDWQQLQVIRRLVRDLDMPVRIIGCPTVRDSDGLALSSRNRFLSADMRARAPSLPQAMRAAIEAILRGAPPADAIASSVAALASAGFEVDYLAMVEPETLRPAASPPARLIAAARLGGVRLLDNMAV